MADNDIYDSKSSFERLATAIPSWTHPPVRGARKYWIKNPENISYFTILWRRCESKDLSYIRRRRLTNVLLFISHVISKNLKDVTRDDINSVLSIGHTKNRSYESKKTFLTDLRHIWRIILPENDEMGRPDETITPYVVRHIRTEPDRSLKRAPKDKMSKEEVKKVFSLFFDRPDVRAALALAYEGLARPQEILGRKISDVEMHEGYAKVWISEHGKEGAGFIPIIDYLSDLEAWMRLHPLRDDPNAPLFLSMGTNCMFQMISPIGFNKSLRNRTRAAGITKPLTLYSFKRNGITHMRLDGKSDNEIQRRARWTTTKQLHTYDLGNQEDAFQRELASRGLLESSQSENAATPVLPKAAAVPVASAPAIVPETKPVIATSRGSTLGFCTDCGAKRLEGAKFCAACGMNLDAGTHSEDGSTHLSPSNEWSYEYRLSY